ncbi:GNAT family N-acetyltransferase [Antrihabitans cavernicola]|uniref:GNAT family N-acetyltransferase n=1 Tax=Antrihabitans cavernicola TaxID=2495913 RepID=A0A5A7S5L4_9NOCA|nr:GNAT family N-acetyltransferase [Spelaeibacter cavernicola]KAA0018462.1 GNAT family N-acetyltransferase [Spelaeibacter cavernicola]
MEYREVDPTGASAAGLRAELLDTWIAATNAGGSVGFTAPAPESLIAVTLHRALERVSTGVDALGVLHNGERYVGMGLLVAKESALTTHWRTVLRVMVHPEHQGSGAGRTLMTGLRQTAVKLGLEQLQLTIRDGQGLQGFYEPLRSAQVSG